jgi:hypothetical protein
MNPNPLSAETPSDDVPRLGADLIPDEGSDDDAETLAVAGYRGGTGDPAFGFLLALALSVGLIPMLPDNADLRYTVAWGALASVSVLGWLLGSADRIAQEDPVDLIWGIGFGALAGALFLLFGSEVFRRTAFLIFPQMSIGTVLAYLVFVMPLAETLFFRGVLQKNLEFYIVGALAGVWNIILFFPVMWAEVLEAPAVAIVIGIAFLTMNMLYSYVRERNGLAAAWLCQMVGVLMTVFVPLVFLTASI